MSGEVMLVREFEIVNKRGLHARASAKLTQLAGNFECEVWMEKGSRRVNAKSIMGVMMLAAEKGSKVIVETAGGGVVAAAAPQAAAPAPAPSAPASAPAPAKAAAAPAAAVAPNTPQVAVG